MRVLVILLGVFALAGCVAPPYTNVDNERLRALIAEGVPVYDVRRAEEWRQTGVVAGSRLLTFVDERGRPNPEFLPRFTSAVGKNDPVILICRTGSRTDVLVRHLVEQLGYTNVYNVRHGINGWLRDRQPVVRSGGLPE